MRVPEAALRAAMGVGSGAGGGVNAYSSRFAGVRCHAFGPQTWALAGQVVR